ncbi:MAG: GNAT family N-acetyltransferase [Sarcina sp.]
MKFNKKIILKNNKELVLRNAISEDAEKILEYLNIIGGESDNLLFGKNEFNLSIEEEKSIINNLNNSKFAIMLLGLIDNNIASIFVINASPKDRISHNALLALSVKKEYWRIGVASASLESIIEIAKAHNIKTISLGVKADNIPAFNLYKKFGFQQIGLHKNHLKINDIYYDEILMDLYLD